LRKSGSPKASYGPLTAANSSADCDHEPRWEDIRDSLSQGLIESTNTKIRVLTRMAYGFKSPEALIALALLALGGYRPELPGRQAAA
jgi:hypothetical protein